MAGTAAAAGSALDELRGQIRGEVVAESDSAYAEACQIWNGMIDRRPALVVRCMGSADVIAAVNFAREAGMPVSVRSGGHNVAGTALSDGGVVVDLTRMRNVFVDSERRPARAAGGAWATSTMRRRRSHSPRPSAWSPRRELQASRSTAGWAS